MNMSYCSFYNTSIDLDDCICALERKDFNNISEDEKRSIIKLLTIQLDNLNLIKEDINIVYGRDYDEELDKDIIEKWINNWDESED